MQCRGRLVCFEIVFFIGLKNRRNFLSQRGHWPPCVCCRLSLTCARPNSMRLLVASYATPCALGLGRGEGKRCFLLMNPPALPCQHTYFVEHKRGKQQQRRAKKDDKCERRTMTMDSRRWCEGWQKRTANDDRRGRQTMIKRVAHDDESERRRTTKKGSKRQQMWAANYN